MRDESLQNIQNNQYVGGGTMPMNLMYFAFGNPITDSMVVNAYAKTSSAAFEMALNTGIYGNHTVAGGNFLYNALQGNKYTGKFFKDSTSWSIQPFKNFKFLGENSRIRNFSWNFIASNDLDKSAGAAVSKLAEKTGLNKTSEIVRTGWGFGRDYSGFFKQLDRMNVTKIGGSINQYGASATKTIKNTGVGIKSWNATSLSNWSKAILTTASDDEVLKLADEYLKIGGSLKSYSKGATDFVIKEVRKELAEGIGKTFASRTAFEKLISNPVVRIATGAAIAMPMSASLALMAVTTGIGMAASIGQNNAINNFINSHLYNETQYDRYSSEEATASLYSAQNIRDSHLQALVNSYSNINVANRYLNDIDSISSEYSFTSNDAETI